MCLEVVGVLEGVLGGCGGFRGCAWRLWGFGGAGGHCGFDATCL